MELNNFSGKKSYCAKCVNAGMSCYYLLDLIPTEPKMTFMDKL